MRAPMRYKVQQNQGEYALKACDDGDLVDWSEYHARVQLLEHLLRSTLTFIAHGKAKVDPYALTIGIEEALGMRP